VAVLTPARVVGVAVLAMLACYDPVLRDCTVTCAGSGACAVTCADDCTYDVACAVPHQLAAVPVANHRFQMWSGACMGSAATCELTIATMPAMLPGPMTMVNGMFANK
jgi:hypothetical protein